MNITARPFGKVDPSFSLISFVVLIVVCVCGVALRLATEKNLKHGIPFDKKMFTNNENTFKPSHKPRKYRGLPMTRKATSTSKRAVPQGK